MENERWISVLHKLANILCSSIASIEILPGGLEDWKTSLTSVEDQQLTPDFPFLFSDGHLGIPKKVLYKLYGAAFALFQSSRSVPELCRVSTCTILLANPAHQTALNARKRLLESGLIDPEEELEFIEVLFRGSSTCAKESILWDHRRWIFTRVYEQHLRSSTYDHNRKWATSADLCPLPSIPPGAMIREFSVIRRACESHPRNYHAWTHWHFVVDIINTTLLVLPDSSHTYIDILVQELAALRTWVNHHVSDHSAIFRLCCLGRLFDDLDSRYPSYEGSLKRSSQSLVEHAHSLVFAYPSHESLWIYLRDSAALLSTLERQKLVEDIESSPLSHFLFSKRLISNTPNVCGLPDL